MKVRSVLMLICGIAIAGCGKHHSATATDGVITGRVLDQDQAPLAGAVVTLLGTSNTATTDASGAYTIVQPKPNDTNIIVAVQNTGYVDQTMRTQLTLGDTGKKTNFTLQKVGTSVSVTLPLLGQPAAVVASDNKDGAVSLSIPANALVDANGVLAAGQVNVDLTYFHPRQFSSTYPLGLAAINANTVSVDKLVTFGMADIHIKQNGSALHVAPGAYLNLDFQAMEAQSTYVQDTNQDNTYWPKLYSADTNTGLWLEEATLGSDSLTWDANSWRFMAKLPHLSAWNIDALDRGAGGCIQGTVLGADNNPAGNLPVRVWLAGRDEVGVFDATTDGSGNYCVEPGVRYGGVSSYIRFFVSGQDSPNNSSMCNPLPTFCSTYVDTTIANDWQTCGLRDDVICSDGGVGGNGDIVYNYAGWGGCSPRSACNSDSSQSDLYGPGCYAHQGSVMVPTYQDSRCSADQKFYATAKAGAHCGGGACYQAPTVTIGGGGTKTTTTTPTPTPKPAPVPCDPASSHTRFKGQSCIPNVDTCCPNDGSLVCQDYVCVPALTK